MPGRIARDYATHATANADDGDGSTVRAQSQGDERLREALRDFVALLPPDRWALLHPETQATIAALDPAASREPTP